MNDVASSALCANGFSGGPLGPASAGATVESLAAFAELEAAPLSPAPLDAVGLAGLVEADAPASIADVGATAPFGPPHPIATIATTTAEPIAAIPSFIALGLTADRASTATRRTPEPTSG